MRKKRFMLPALLILCLSLAAPGLAAGESIAGYYAADSCEKDGEPYRCDEDYLILYEDGTGIAAFNGERCAMTWTRKGDSFSMKDEEGYRLKGVYDGGTITGKYAGYDYVYVFTGSIPAEDTKDEDVPPADEAPKDGDVPPADEDAKKADVPPVDEDARKADILAAAAELDLRYFPAVSRGVDGGAWSAKGDYLLLYQGGKGMVAAAGYAYFIDWTINGSALSFTDHMGETGGGVIEGDRVTAQYRGYDYVWEASDECAPITLLAPQHWDADLPNIFDQADILTDEEEAQLGRQAAALTQQYHCKVYIVTVDDMTNYTLSDSVDAFSDEMMMGYRIGYGADLNAVILTLSMAERDYNLKAGGPVGNSAFTDYGREAIAEHFLDDFGDDDWYGGFSDYLKWCEKLLKAYDNGKPYDWDSDPVTIALAFLVITAVYFLISLLICWILKRRMQSVKQKSEAGSYVPDGGFEITFRNDSFSHKTVRRVYDPPSKGSGSSGGGGGTTVGSSGHSSSSGKF